MIDQPCAPDIDETAVPDIDLPPANLPTLPEGVWFNGCQEFKGERLWTFSDRATGGTFMLLEGASEEQVGEAVRIRRQALINHRWSSAEGHTPQRKIAMGPGRIAR